MDKFNFVRLDTLSDEEIIDIEGNKTTAGDWLAKTGNSYRPALLFFGDGKMRADVTGLIKTYHFQRMLEYVGSKKYKEYETLRDYSRVARTKILESGKNIDLWK